MPHPNDYHTSTVSGAEAFEQQRAKEEREEIDLPDLEDEQEEDYERCGCSDPDCPCEGNKRL